MTSHCIFWLRKKIPYILESNPHPFYSFRGLKHQMRIRFTVVSWILEKTVELAIKWPLHTRRGSRITVKALATSNIMQALCLEGKGRLKERCGLEPRTNIFRLRNRQKLMRIRFWCGLDYRIYGTLKLQCTVSLRKHNSC